MMSAATSKPNAAQPALPSFSMPPGVSRPVIVAVTGFAALGGFMVTSPEAAATAAANAGPELTRLLRAMAGLKMLMAGSVAAGMFWRLGSPIAPARLAAYIACCIAMAAAPGVIWSMAHIGVGALLLHGGLLASMITLWRDPAVSSRLAALVTRQRLRAGQPGN